MAQSCSCDRWLSTCVSTNPPTTSPATNSSASNALRRGSGGSGSAGGRGFDCISMSCRSGQQPAEQAGYRGRHSKDGQENGQLLGDRIAGLADAEPQVDPGSDQPQRDKYLCPGDGPRHATKRMAQQQAAQQ